MININGMRVALVMFYDDAIREYGDLTFQINQLYCLKHGLDLICSHETAYQNRHPAWERLPLLLKHLPNYDYLVWIDADAFFYFHSTSIIDMIKTTPQTDFIFSRDIGNGNINTGIFVVKNTDYSYMFLSKWAYDEELYNTNPYPKWWDQGVLIGMIGNNAIDIQTHCVTYDYGVLQHFFKHEIQSYKIKPFIMHLASWSYNDRVHTAKMYLNLLKTNSNVSIC
jgi:hypothetical protein